VVLLSSSDVASRQENDAVVRLFRVAGLSERVQNWSFIERRRAASELLESEGIEPHNTRGVRRFTRFKRPASPTAEALLSPGGRRGAPSIEARAAELALRVDLLRSAIQHANERLELYRAQLKALDEALAKDPTGMETITFLDKKKRVLDARLEDEAALSASKLELAQIQSELDVRLSAVTERGRERWGGGDTDRPVDAVAAEAAGAQVYHADAQAHPEAAQDRRAS
jgi:hypothetical protein